MRGRSHQSGSFPPHEPLPPNSFPPTDPPLAPSPRLLQPPPLPQQHSFPLPSLDPRLLQNLLFQDFARNGAQSSEDRQKLLRLIKSMGSGTGHTSSDAPRYGSGQRSGIAGLFSQELRGEIGGGILDLHSIDDVELLPEDSVHESPFDMSTFAAENGFGNESNSFWSSNNPQNGKLRAPDEERTVQAPFESDVAIKSNTSGLARIKVVVRKRPLNKKEVARKEEDIVTIDGNGCSLTVNEPKLKVDLTAYVEKHDFVFDAVLDEHVSNDEVYKVTVEPIIPTIFQCTKATCFAYGQTGSGKTYTMQPLPLRACHDILNIMHHPSYRNQGLQLWLSFFEIYGGKLYDLLTDRRKLCMREDGRQQVCIVGLKEFPISDVQSVKDYIEKGNGSRSTGSTGANEESSRSHAILQLAIKKHSNKKDEKEGKLVGKFSFIDLAGSERGADTTDNDRQTRIEGAEINKSLLALKECIRALDAEQGHIPFRGSKLTEVLRDSFVGDSRTIMISCISPNTGSCEHTLNTLRYADRVKGLSKTSNIKRDPSPGTGNQLQKDTSSVRPAVSADVSHSGTDYKVSETSKSVSQLRWPGHSVEPDSFSQSSSNQFKEDSKIASHSTDTHYTMGRGTVSNSSTYSRIPERTGQEMVSPQQRQVLKVGTSDEDSGIERNVALSKKAISVEEFTSLKTKDRMDTAVPQQNGYDSQITAILEEEEDLISAHRLEVEDAMDLVREEMRLLTEVDQPGSRIDRYVSQLSYVLSRKAAGIVNLQARLARFQHRLKEQEILSRGIDNS